MLNKLKSGVKPSSVIIEQAVTLLSTFGDPNKLKSSLVEMKEVQKHNEGVLLSAHKALLDLDKKIQAWEKEKFEKFEYFKDKEAEFNFRGLKFTNDETSLSNLKQQFEQQTLEVQEGFVSREHDVHKRERESESDRVVAQNEKQVSERIKRNWVTKRDDLNKREDFLRNLINIIHNNLPERI